MTKTFLHFIMNQTLSFKVKTFLIRHCNTFDDLFNITKHDLDNAQITGRVDLYTIQKIMKDVQNNLSLQEEYNLTPLKDLEKTKCTQAIIDLMMEHGYIMSLEQISNYLPQFPKEDIVLSLYNKTYFAYVGMNYYETLVSLKCATKEFIKQETNNSDTNVQFDKDQEDNLKVDEILAEEISVEEVSNEELQEESIADTSTIEYLSYAYSEIDRQLDDNKDSPLQVEAVLEAPQEELLIETSTIEYPSYSYAEIDAQFDNQPDEELDSCPTTESYQSVAVQKELPITTFKDQLVAQAVENILIEYKYPMSLEQLIKKLPQFSRADIWIALNIKTQFIPIGMHYYDQIDRWQNCDPQTYYLQLPNAIQDLLDFTVNRSNHCSYKLVMMATYIDNVVNDSIKIDLLKQLFVYFYYDRLLSGLLIERPEITISKISRENIKRMQQLAPNKPLDAILNSGYSYVSDKYLCFSPEIALCLRNSDIRLQTLFFLLKNINIYYTQLQNNSSLEYTELETATIINLEDFKNNNTKQNSSHQTSVSENKDMSISFSDISIESNSSDLSLIKKPKIKKIQL